MEKKIKNKPPFSDAQKAEIDEMRATADKGIKEILAIEPDPAKQLELIKKIEHHYRRNHAAINIDRLGLNKQDAETFAKIDKQTTNNYLSSDDFEQTISTMRSKIKTGQSSEKITTR